MIFVTLKEFVGRDSKSGYKGLSVPISTFINEDHLRLLGYGKASEMNKLEQGGYIRRETIELPADKLANLDLLKQEGRSKEHIAELAKILEDPELFAKVTVGELDKKIVGELENRQTIFLCAAGGRLVANASPASYNLLINSESGAGKDHVTGNVLKILPKRFVEKRTRISPNAFTYWHSSKKEPEFTWDGKICYLADISNNILNHDVFKVMCTEGSHATIVVDQKAEDLEIKGKPVMIITAAAAEPNAELLRRFSILNLTETENQTEAIMQRICSAAETGASTEYNQKIIDSFEGLKRVKVLVPFAQLLFKGFNSRSLIMRTHMSRLLDYIKASAALHQYQRKLDLEKGCVLAEPKDYDIARIAIIQTTSNKHMIPLTHQKRKLIEFCKDKGWLTVAEIHKGTPAISERSIRTWLSGLTPLFFEVKSERVETSDRPVTKYKLSSQSSLHIPTWDELNSCRNTSNASSGSNGSISSFTSNTNAIEAIEPNEVPNVRTIVAELDTGQGADQEEVVKRTSEDALSLALVRGDVYPVGPGRIKLLN